MYICISMNTSNKKNKILIKIKISILNKGNENLRTNLLQFNIVILVMGLQ